MATRSVRVIGAAIAAFFGLSGSIPAQGPNNDSPAGLVQRAAAAHGKSNGAADPQDWVAEGKLIVFATDGPKGTFDVTLQHKGTSQVQRIIKETAGELKQGTDGTRTWESFGGFYTPAAQGRALQFIESQTVRSTQRLFNHQSEGLTLHDKGKKDNANLVEAEDRNGKKTTYHVDTATSVIRKLEFIAGQGKDPFSGKLVDIPETFVFSDYRSIQGLLTPFKIERFNDGIKTEEMQFTAVRYNAGLKDQDFKH